MMPIFKVLTGPFRSSKSKKSRKLVDSQDGNGNQSPIDPYGENIQLQKGIGTEVVRISSLKQIKSQDIYNQVERMVDQLGSMFSFKQKMSQHQKRQLIAQLSSMAIATKGTQEGNRFVEQDVQDENDEEQNQQHEQVQPCIGKLSTSLGKQKDEQTQTRSNSLEKSQDSPASQKSPEKHLFDLFQCFQNQHQENGGQHSKHGKNSKGQIKKALKTSSLSSFSQIKEQMGKFWVKNSSIVLKMMGPKKQSKSQRALRKQLSKRSCTQVRNIKMTKKKSMFSMSSFIPSWKSKKQQKTMNSTASTTLVDNENNLQQGDMNSDKKQHQDMNEWENSNINFNKAQSCHLQNQYQKDAVMERDSLYI